MEADIRAVTEVCHVRGVQVKVIFETDALTPEEIRGLASDNRGGRLLKTSTGFYTGRSDGATRDHRADGDRARTLQMKGRHPDPAAFL